MGSLTVGLGGGGGGTAIDGGEVLAGLGAAAAAVAKSRTMLKGRMAKRADEPGVDGYAMR